MINSASGCLRLAYCLPISFVLLNSCKISLCTRDEQQELRTCFKKYQPFERKHESQASVSCLDSGIGQILLTVCTWTQEQNFHNLTESQLEVRNHWDTRRTQRLNFRVAPLTALSNLSNVLGAQPLQIRNTKHCRAPASGLFMCLINFPMLFSAGLNAFSSTRRRPCKTASCA